MGRPSKLSPDQWRELERRLNAGESATVLSREFDVSQGLISQRFSKISKEVKKTAEAIAESQNMLAVLPVAQQYQAISLAEKLRNISTNLASAAEYGAATAHKLQAIAHAQVKKIDEADPMNSQEQLQAISALTRISNDSARLGTDLINANKATSIPPEQVTPVMTGIKGLSDGELDQMHALLAKATGQ